MAQDDNHPECQFKARGGISSAIWRTQSTKDGGTADRFSIKLQKRYRDPTTGEWKGSELYLFPSEIPALLTVTSKAYEHCVLLEQDNDAEDSIPV